MTHQPPKTEADIDLLCNVPGPEGVMWRLVKQWNPDGISTWMAGEGVRGTPIDHMLRAFGNLLSAAAFGFALNTDNPREAMMGPGGIIQHFQASLQAKVNAHKAKMPSGIIMPQPGEMS